MYYNPYEEYMRNSLGYNMVPPVEPYENENIFTYEEPNVDDMYPEIYRMVYPMVCKACMNVEENITEDLVGRLTEEIYKNIEQQEVSQENRSNTSNGSAQTGKAVRIDNNNQRTNQIQNNNIRHEDRNRNPFLRDLIRILVLRELVGRPSRPPYRPPMPPPPPPRPPFGGPGPIRPPMPGPGGPGPRPEPRSPYMF